MCGGRGHWPPSPKISPSPDQAPALAAAPAPAAAHMLPCPNICLKPNQLGAELPATNDKVKASLIMC